MQVAVSKTRPPWSAVKCLRCRRNAVAVIASAEEQFRNKVKHLTRLFYAQDITEGPGRSRQPLKPRALKGSQFQSLPLWRVEWAVLPGMQEILHVVAPHYVHMFEGIFSQPRPWVFGHLYLPGGSRNLGGATHRLTSGSQSPLVGVMMAVTRAVRLRDGKMLLLATGLGRFKVVSCLRELPYSVADVELLADCEDIEGWGQVATTAVMQAAADDTSLSALMAASSTAAREAAARQHWAWLQGYELKVAAQQEWPGPGPREGENDFETYALVQELAEQGVADVLPLPDGVVIGRFNLQQVAADAEVAVQQVLQEAAAQLNSGSSSNSSSGRSRGGDSQPEEQSSGSSSSASPDAGRQSPWGSSSSIIISSSPTSSRDGSSSIVSLNTTAERGVALLGAEVSLLTSNSSTCGTLEEVLMLEAAVWQQLDILAALSSRVKGRRHALPFGLLQLRPPQPQLSVAAATALANKAAAASTQYSSTHPAAASSSSSNDTAPGVSSSRNGGAIPHSPSHPPPAEVVSESEDDDSSPSNSRRSGSKPEHAPNSSSSSIRSPGDSLNLSSRSADAADPGQQWASTSQYAFAASEGTDVAAHPLWPPLRRAARLSWAAALVTGQLDLDKGDMRQALLETPSVASRLRFVLAVLQKHAKVLAALAAVKDVQD